MISRRALARKAPIQRYPGTRDASATLPPRRDSGMTLRTVSFLALARLGLIAVAVTACGTASSYLGPSGSTTTLMAGWEHRFKLEWSVDPEPDGNRRIRGYIASQYGERAEAVRVLGQALDASGAVVGPR